MKVLGWARTAGMLGLALALTACTILGTPPKPSVYETEKFQGDETFSRLIDAGSARACEAARRTLLSQGYVISQAQAGTVNAVKRFQPQGDVHLEISFNVVCVAEGEQSGVSTAYVSAQQDRYVIRRSSNSASIGVSALGSVSVPLSSSEDSMVKVASETIPAGEFYDRFFTLMQRIAREMARDDMPPMPVPPVDLSAPLAPSPTPAPASSPSP